MEQYINRAIELYSGDKPVDLFVDRLEQNLNSINFVFNEISQLFISAGVQNFERLPESIPERGRFASLFKDLNNFLEAAKIQGFKWDQLKYEFDNGTPVIELNFDENTYLILALRYRELFSGDGGGIGTSEVPFEIEGHLTEIDTDKIDADYMNSRFEKFLKELKGDDVDSEQLQHTLDELHKSFATLTQEEQKYANIFIHDVQSGILSIESGKTFREYITEYLFNAKNDQIFRISEVLGLEESKLRNMMDAGITENNINEYGRFDNLKSTVDKNKAKEYFEKKEDKTIPAFRVNIKFHDLLQEFIISDGFEI
jgi:type I restriction enzyme R subunit